MPPDRSEKRRKALRGAATVARKVRTGPYSRCSCNVIEEGVSNVIEERDSDVIKERVVMSSKRGVVTSSKRGVVTSSKRE